VAEFLHPVGGVPDPERGTVEHRSVYDRGANIAMLKEFPHGADVMTIFE